MKPIHKALTESIQTERYRRQDKDGALWTAFAVLAYIYAIDLVCRVALYMSAHPSWT